MLTHEEVVDLLWKDGIQPLLKQRFPAATDDDLKKAHAFAYGGSLVQDMGYYPFGNKEFSDLTHYVRSGDFVVEPAQGSLRPERICLCPRRAGALLRRQLRPSHHQSGRRRSNSPSCERKFGKEVTYEDNPKAHIRTEFGFDVTQVAKNRYTSDRYHDFIGFEILQTRAGAGLSENLWRAAKRVISDEDLAIGTFRRAISKVIPEMTRVALVAHRKEIVAETPNFKERQFRYYLSRTNYQKEWGKSYRRPGFGTRVLAFFLNFVPKVGPFKALDFKIPTQTN